MATRPWLRLIYELFNNNIGHIVTFEHNMSVTAFQQKWGVNIIGNVPGPHHTSCLIHTGHNIGGRIYLIISGLVLMIT